MNIWQPLMISLARNQFIKKKLQSSKSLARLANRFVGGKGIVDAVAMASGLKEQQLNASLFYLGEYVDDAILVEKAVGQLELAIKELSKKSLDIHISVDPTQVGLQIDEEFCRDNIKRLCRVLTDFGKTENNGNAHRLMLDMEDSSVTEFTVNLYKELLGSKLKVAITLQAYLLRTEQDLEAIISAGGTVRLVKGAFAESSKISLTRKKEIDAQFLKLSQLMLSESARRNGFYPVFATHDDKLIKKIIKFAEEKNWPKGRYEFEMLYGVREDMQKSLVAKDEQLRLYLPSGKDWWPYVARRIGENPKNLLFLLRAFMRF